MTRQQVAYRNRLLQRLSSAPRAEIKKVLTQLAIEFARKSKNQKDPTEIIKTLQNVLSDSDFSEKILEIRKKYNKVDYFGNRFFKDLNSKYNELKK